MPCASRWGLFALAAAPLAAAPLAACGIHLGMPSTRAHDARFGYLGGTGAGAPDHDALCRDWEGAVEGRDSHAESHVSYPEAAPEAACYTPVLYRQEGVTVGDPPSGCAFPTDEQTATVSSLADRLESSGSARDRSALFPCVLTTPASRSAARNNALSLRALARRRGAARYRYPYAAVVTFGFGDARQGGSSLVLWQPGDRCVVPAVGDLAELGPMVPRAIRAAEAWHARVAPFVVVSGGTAHSPLVEAFAMDELLVCFLGVPRDAVIVEPCAEHTHTNLRNSARWLVAMGARVAYVVTDDGLQADYLEEYSGFDLIGGNVDQRSLRDWGYLIGSWRRAARGERGIGFWFTPYRFWAEPRDGLGGVTCVDR